MSDKSFNDFLQSLINAQSEYERTNILSQNPEMVYPVAQYFTKARKDLKKLLESPLPFNSPNFETTNLPIDNASRLSRAKELGFDTSKKWYHGTSSDINAFDNSKLGKSTGAPSAALGHFFTSDPSTASDYANLAGPTGDAEEKHYVRADTSARMKGKILNNNRAIKTVLKKILSSKKELGEDELRDLQTKNPLFFEAYHKQDISDSAKKGIRFIGEPVFDSQQINLLDELYDIRSDKRFKKIQELLDDNSELHSARNILLNDIDTRNYTDFGQQVTPVFLRQQNPYIHDFKGAEYRDQSYYDIIKRAKKLGHDSVILKNTYDPADPNNRKLIDVAVAFDPKDIRSQFARFDPAKSESADLAAFSGGKKIKFPSIGKALGVAGTVSDISDIAHGDIAEGALGLGSLVAGRASPYLGALRPEKTVSEELESRQLQEAKERQESEEEAKYKREALKRLMSSQED